MLSSSSLKCILESPEKFFKEYILGHRQQSDAAHFAEGSLVHTLILEPHMIDTYAVFPGMRKQGILWEAFKAENVSKTIVSAPQLLRCERLVKAYASLSVASDLIAGGLPEHNMMGNILGVPLKARADSINLVKRIIVDVKTTGMPSDIDLFKQTVNQYSYHLSASLYCRLAYDTYGELFDFYWLVLSKDDGQCHVYKASEETLALGEALVTKALHKYKSCLKSGLWVDNNIKESYNSSDYEVLEV